ncbi:MAG: DUF433 domain-containing protein [Anaerolineae bacterium]
MAALVYAHIGFNDAGVPIISETQTKVEEIVLDHIAYQWDADEIHDQHPHLTLAEIHSALAYYYDHQVEMDEQIEEGLRHVADIRSRLGDSPIRLKLRAQGLLP